MKILIFLNGRKNPKIGGRCGYVANLFSGVEKAGLSGNFVLIENQPRKVLSELLGEILSKFCWGSVRRKRIRRSWNIARLGFRRTILGHLSEEAKQTLSRYGSSENICLCNSVTEFELVREYAERKALRFKLGLISHHPCAPHKEIFESFSNDYEKGFLTKEQTDAKKDAFLKIERDAFLHADFLLFPSKESMEPYFRTWEEFSSVIFGKKIIFAETGVAEKRCGEIERKQLEQKYGLSPDAKFRVCYLGRHNEIKGYDILIRAAGILRKTCPDIEFCIGGVPSGIVAPDFPQWRECGYVNPAELFSVSDLFVLPNRQTYFDLVLLEALAAGIPVLASDTGGNKSVARHSSGVRLFVGDETGVGLSDGILRLAETKSDERRALGEANRRAYQKEYTEARFAQRIYEELRKAFL